MAGMVGMVRRGRGMIGTLGAASVTALLLASVSGAALAQSQAVPPQHSLVDQNGVDLIGGSLTFRTTDVTIGDPSAGGMVYGRVFSGGGWTDTMLDGLYCTSVCAVVANGVSEEFTQTNGVFTPRVQNGSSLTQSGDTYLYIGSDGTRLEMELLGWPMNGFAKRRIDPDGLITTYNYVQQQYCFFPDGSGGCASYAMATRLQSVTNSVGYQMHFEYASNTFDQLNSGPFYTVTKVTGINNAVDYCNPQAFSCTGLTRTWPSATYQRTPDPFPQILSGTQTVTDQSGRVTTYHELGPGKIDRIRLAGQTSDLMTISWDSTGRVSGASGPNGSWSYAYVDGPYVYSTTASGPLGQSLTVALDGTTGLVASTTDAAGSTYAYEYDAGRRVIGITAPEGNSTELTYDGRGNLTEVTAVAKPGSGLADIVTSAAYLPTCANPIVCNQPTSTTDARGNVTDYTYDPTHGGVLTVTAPAPSPGATRPQTRVTYAAQTAYFKNSAGAIVAAPTSVIKPVEVSSCATAASCDGTAGEVVTAIAYGSTGVANNLNVTRVTEGSGAKSMAGMDLTYTANGDLETVDGPLLGGADTTRYRYDAARQLVGVIGPDPDGSGPLQNRAERVTYDASGQVVRTEAGVTAGQSDTSWTNFTQLQRVDTDYDAYGRVAMVEQTTGGVAPLSQHQFSYDAAGRVMCSTVRMNLDSMVPTNACTAEVAADRITYTTYDAVGRPTHVTQAYGRPEAGTEVVSYAPNGGVATMTDSNGNVSVVEYDGHDRAIKLRYPSPSSAGSTSTTDYEQIGYDAAGNAISYRSRAGQVTTVTRDALNRPTFVNMPSGTPDLTYRYDLLGRMTSASTSGILPIVCDAQTICYQWDALSRMTTEVGRASVSYAYDSAGRMTGISWPDGFFAQYDRDLTGAVTAIRENGASSGAGVLAAYTYNNRGQVSAISRGNGVTTAYGYDTHGRMTSLAHNAAGTAGDVTFGYSWNAAGQISARTVSNPSYNFAPGAGVTSYANDGLNRVTSVAGTGVGYDANHNITSALGATYGYDAANRLTSANIAGTAYTFGYDPEGRLDTTSPGGGRFLYSGQQLIGELDTWGNVLTRHVPGPGLDMPVASLLSGGLRYQQLADERGSVIGLTNASAAVTGFNIYDEYGIGQASDRFQYTGQVFMAPGLYNYRARAYAPQMGRFLQSDPMGYSAGMNTYAYVGGDPVNRVDPDGMEWCLIGGYREVARYRNSGPWGNAGDVAWTRVYPEYGECTTLSDVIVTGIRNSANGLVRNVRGLLGRVCPVARVEGVVGGVLEGRLGARGAASVSGSADLTSIRYRLGLDNGRLVSRGYITQGTELSGSLGIPQVDRLGVEARHSYQRETDFSRGSSRRLREQGFRYREDEFVGFQGGFAVVAGGNFKFGVVTRPCGS